MKSVTFGIFAHPDDAAFGPSGTLCLAAQSGDVHLVCATCGGNGANPDHVSSLSDVREAEEKHAAELIGASSLELFRYEDGTLNNNLYLELGNKIITHVHNTLEKYREPTEATLITFDTNGLSGHIDHIAVALATTYAYLSLHAHYPTMRLKYFCLSDEVVPHANTDWLFMPKGRVNQDISETIDVRSVKEQKLEIIHAHATQRADADHNIAMMGDHLFNECFYEYKD